MTQSSNTLESEITGATYQWVTCPQMAAILNDTNQTFIAENNGDYALIISDGNCTDTSSCFTVSTVGYLDNSTREELRIYPNPSNTGLIQTNTDLNHSNIKVFSIEGKQINFTKTKNVIDISNNEKGVYLISIDGEVVKYTYSN